MGPAATYGRAAAHVVDRAPVHVLCGHHRGLGAEEAEVAGDADDFCGDGAAGFDGQSLLGGAAREQLVFEVSGAAQGGGDAGKDQDAVGGAEVRGEEAVIRGAGATTIESGGKLTAAGDEPVNDENEDQPADDGEQTVYACRGVGKARGLRRGGHRAAVRHEAVSVVKIKNCRRFLF